LVAKQAATVLVTPSQVMARAAFAAGVNDVRTGAPIRFDSFSVDDDWSYERGRQWALVAPMSMPLRLGRRLNPAAVLLFCRAIASKEIL
jgi:hypothetical protein